MKTHSLYIALIALFVPLTASGFSAKTHIFFANQIHDSIERDGENYVLKLKTAPYGVQMFGLPLAIPLEKGDAEAIRDNLLYFRGGTVGPDNTVMTKLTDLSHAPQYRPFQQCEALYDEALVREELRNKGELKDGLTNGSERAYALGCFVHGIGDNVIHHLVNYLTGETFTFTPKPDPDGTSAPSDYSNMQRHMAAEEPYEVVIDESLLTHDLATELIQRVYFDPTNETDTGLWNKYTKDLVIGKKAAIADALGIDLSDPTADLTDRIIQITEQNEKPWKTDIDVVTAYAAYLKDHLDPVHAFLMLPEIVRDIKKLYDIIDAQGTHRADSLKWLSIGAVEKRLLKNAFEPRKGETKSLFKQRKKVKFEALDELVPAYLAVVKELSNLDAKHDLFSPSVDRASAFVKLGTTIDKIKEIDATIFFSDWFIAVTGPLADGMGKIFDLVTDKLRDVLVEKAKAELKTLVDKLQAGKPLARAYVGSMLEAARTKLGIGAVPFLESVVYLNAYNSAVGVLADRNVVVKTVNPFDLRQSYADGPVSFDASYQLQYNQLALCDADAPINYRDHFYPCGITAGEMLQAVSGCTNRLATDPAYAAEPVEPYAECHWNSTERYVDPTAASCKTVSIENFFSEQSSEKGSGSWSMSYPKDHAAEPPSCRVLGLFNEKRFGKADGWGTIEETSGCNIANGHPDVTALLALLLLGLFIRRR